MYKKLLPTLSFTTCMSPQVLIVADDQSAATLPQAVAESQLSSEQITEAIAEKPEPSLKLDASLITLCPNPDCSKKIDALPKTKKVPGGYYHCGYSYWEHCPVCGDERNIKFFDE
jgi:hypothetical protein